MSFLGTISTLCRSPSRASLSVVSILALLTFSGCSSLPLQVTSTPADIERPVEKPVIPDPQPINTAPVKWLVLTPDRLPKGGAWVYYGITPQQYEVMARNMADILRWVKEARWRLDYYSGKGGLDGAPLPAKEPQEPK